MTDGSHGVPQHFIVFVPGIMGSKLQKGSTGEIAWIDFSTLPPLPWKWDDWVNDLLTTLRYPNDDLVPAGIVDDVLFLPPWIKQEQYSRMFAALERLGYRTDPLRHSEEERNVYAFAYDWRQDNRTSARQLAQSIERWRGFHPDAQVWIIAHSMGGLVSRWYIEKEEGKDHVSRLFLVASPWDGAPKALTMLTEGLSVLFRKQFGFFADVQRQTRDLIRTFPSAYQLLPYQNPFLHGQGNEVVDLYSPALWLEDPHQRELLLDGRAFNEELGRETSVETLCFFGVKQLTTTNGVVTVAANNRWDGIAWQRNGAGDGTVPERSAVHRAAAEKLPFAAGHGDIYVNPALLEKLEWELIGRYQPGVLAEVEADGLHIMFEPTPSGAAPETEQVTYEPGERVSMRASVKERDSGRGVLDATITATAVWHQALPGSQTTALADTLPSARLVGSVDGSGTYEGELAAPQQEGYYRLEAAVDVPGHRTVYLEELILVEAPPTRPEAEAAPEVQARMAGAEPPREESAEATPPDAAVNAEAAGRAAQEITFGGGRRTRGIGTLGGDVPRMEPEPTPTVEAPAGGQRQVCAEFEDGAGDQPLKVDELVTLAFFVSTEPCGERAASVAFDESAVFEPGEEMIELRVHLSTMDFTVLTPEPQQLFVPRSGKSRNKARFTLKARREGAAELTAFLYKNGNFIQGVEIRVQVGGDGDRAIVGTSPMGRPLEGVAALQRREISLVIKPYNNQFIATMISTAGSSDGVLGVTAPQLDQMIKDARLALLDVVYLGSGNGDIRTYPKGTTVPLGVDRPYQSGLDVPGDVSKIALRRLAEAGHLLYRDLFFGPASDANTQLMGETLRDLAGQHRQNIQIVSREFLLPWNMLYLAEEFDPSKDDVRPELFMGFGHVVEHIPYQAKQRALDNVIPSKPELRVGVNVNPDIDQQMGITVISDQKAYWSRLNGKAGTMVAVREAPDTISSALTDAGNPEQIQYFYCHALSEQLDSANGPGSSYLGLAGGTHLTLKELRQRASEQKVMLGAPLVVVNACESAELSPLFYGGFMPYFTARGARGMIGAEAEIPALFAATWAELFFEDFLSGTKSLGQVMFDLRWEFLRKHGNALGLLYAMYCDGDTRVVPGLGLA